MQAVIIAGGEGTRLRPLTSTTPKPMLPIANKPMIGHVIELLAAHGVTDIIVTVAYLGNAIRNYLGDGSEFGVSVRYLQEETPLGTAGAVAHARHLVRGTFLVLSGDVLTDINLGEAIQFHQHRNAKATMVLTAVDAPTEFGIVATDATGRVEQLIEKPTWGEVFTDTVNTGIYVLEPEVLDTIATDRSACVCGCVPADDRLDVSVRSAAGGELREMASLWENDGGVMSLGRACGTGTEVVGWGTTLRIVGITKGCEMICVCAICWLVGWIAVAALIGRPLANWLAGMAVVAVFRFM